MFHLEEIHPMRIAGRFFACLIVCGAVAPAIAADRTAEEIVKELDALKPPSTAAIMKAQGDERTKLIEAYRAEIKTMTTKHSALAAELLKVDPKNAKLATVLPQRWMTLAQDDKAAEALTEIDTVLKGSPDEALQKEATFARAQVLLSEDDVKADDVLTAIDAFEKLSPKDRRMPSLLYGAASSIDDNAKRTALEDRLLKEFENPQIKQMITAAREMRAKVGKPFELEFEDAIKGSTVSIKGLKGKVVVVDFWATWCGPCVAEMPKMKKLYAELKDQGVEFIGVSLDQPKEKGGLTALKEYVAKNDIQWPQYYQGNYWQSEFSKGWGINSIPCVFIVDQDGNLFSTEGRGKIDKIVPKLLEKSKAPAGAGGQ
jgi:thiol-disulfide isomerase/thioredoxin